MKLLIDKIKLKYLLEQKRDYIRNSIQGIDLIITAIIFMFSLLCSDFHSIFGIHPYVVATIAWILAIVILLYGLIKLIISIQYRYSHEILYHDIENINEVLHRFSIVAVKDDFLPHANRYLLYYDNAWKCWFFFSFHTAECQNEESICQRLSNKLKVDVKAIQLKYISDRIQPKYSERDQVNKVYQHSLYQCKIMDFPEKLQQDSFEIDGTQYRWFTINDMEKDDTIMSKNSDVVSYVKEKVH